MAAELFVVPEPEFGDGDGGDGEDGNLADLAYLAQRIVEAYIAKIDWDVCKEAALLVTDDEADASTVLYLMRRASITVQVEGVEDLS